ncbi:thioesterase II family protein [Actinoplanes sp. N902-109]|uniref:thioesterase II family protein n=1 Tax=Actinoplanes sp. (strain N902-109) TaxID=649831 RepID=UPI000329593D|nr:thioesterase domain-containing protein [Actinoplanes sp. N902-109]AGL15855.1 thioesterase [Actinoplanes sp. N902-109]
MSSTIGAQLQQPVASGQWLHPAEPGPDAAIRLFLLPHAGSGAIIYRDWQNLLPPDIAAQAVTLPGRHHRREEASYAEWDPLLQALYEALDGELDDRPYAFFGHCMGAQLGYRLTRMIEAAGRPAPVLLGMSGWAPEGFFQPTEEQSRMPEPEMVEWIKKLGSFPAEIYDNPEMLALVVPALRADLAVCAEYRDDGAPVGCPVVSYGGRSDPLMQRRDAMDSWISRTPVYLGHSEFSGGHFYIDTHAQAVTVDFTRHLHRLAAG